MNRIPIMLDVDTGLDDALAILLAKDCPNLELLGICTVSGNAPVEHTYANTKYLAKLLGLTCPIAKGAAYPMINKVLHAQEVHGSYGLGPIMIEPEYEKHGHPASALYEKLLTQAQEPVTIIATGPLTNLAHLILNHPELHPKIKAISFMGGSLGAGNVTPYAEFNAHFDPEAVDVVLRSGIPLIMAGLQLTNTLRSDFIGLDTLIQDPDPAQKTYLDLVHFYVQNAKERGYVQGGALHDSVAVAAVAYPEKFTTEPKAVVMELEKGEHRGQTKIEGDTLNVTALISVDLQFMVDLTLQSILHCGRSV